MSNPEIQQPQDSVPVPADNSDQLKSDIPVDDIPEWEIFLTSAVVVELVDTPSWGGGGESRVSSSLTVGTTLGVLDCVFVGG